MDLTWDDWRAVIAALLVIGGAFSALCGVLLAVAPRSFESLAARANQWYSLRRALRPLDHAIHRERQLYRYHRPLGAFLLLGSAYTLYSLVFRLAPATLELAVAQFLGPQLRPWAAENLRLLLFLGNLFAFGVGLIVFIRPSELKPLEQRGNRWISLRGLTRPLDRSHGGIEASVRRHARLTGILVALGGLYIAAMALLLLNRP